MAALLGHTDMSPRDQAEAQLLAKIKRGEWVSAMQLADRVGWPWRVVARALQRLMWRSLLETKTVEWKSRRYRTRRTTLYRRRVPSVVVPSWLSPVARPVAGGRVVSFGTDQDGDGPE